MWNAQTVSSRSKAGAMARPKPLSAGHGPMDSEARGLLGGEGQGRREGGDGEMQRRSLCFVPNIAAVNDKLVRSHRDSAPVMRNSQLHPSGCRRSVRPKRVRTVLAVVEEQTESGSSRVEPAREWTGTLPYAQEVDEFVNSPVVEAMISVLVLLQCISFAVESLPIDLLLRDVLVSLESLITTVFATEYLLRWYGKGLNARYLFRKLMVIDLIAILPGFLTMAGSSVNLQFVRLLRVWRIFRLQRMLQKEEFNKMFGFNGSVSETNLRVAEIVVTVFSILYVSSALLYEAEVAVSPTIDNFFDAFYFTLVTLTTVGFGDITPVTPLGKFFVSCSILTGVFLIPYQLGRLAEAVLGDMGMNVTYQDEAECTVCGAQKHTIDAIFCRVCGSRLSAKYRW